MNIELINKAFDACKKGDVQKLESLLNKLENKEIVDEKGCSLLNIALKNGQWLVAELLLESGFEYCTKDSPAVISACQFIKDDTKGIDLLKKFDIDLKQTNKQNRSALMTSSLMGHKSKVKKLIDSNLDIHLIDDHGNHCLNDAVQSNKIDIVKLLIKQSPDLKQINSQGQNALIICVSQKKPNEEIVKLLLEYGFDPEQSDKNNKSAWQIASQKHPKIQKIISNFLNTANQIELPIFSVNDTNVEKEDNKEINSTEPKVEASKNLEKDIVDKKDDIEHKKEEEAEVQITNKIVDPSIEGNFEAKNLDAVEKITAPIFKESKQSLTKYQEWFLAAKNGNLGQLNRLIIEGIDINCKDEQGCTALIRASGNKRRAVVSFLLQQKANIETRSKNGSTALSSSIIGNCRRVTGLLLDNGANPNGHGPANYNYATIAAAQWNEAMLSILHRYNSNLNVFNDKNQNLAHVASLATEHFQEKVTNAKNTFAFLHDHGIDLNHQDQDGNTPLLILCGVDKLKYKIEERNLAPLLHFVIKLGASPVISNHKGITALDVVRKHKLMQCKGVIMNALSWNESGLNHS